MRRDLHKMHVQLLEGARPGAGSSSASAYDPAAAASPRTPRHAAHAADNGADAAAAAAAAAAGYSYSFGAALAGLAAGSGMDGAAAAAAAGRPHDPLGAMMGAYVDGSTAAMDDTDADEDAAVAMMGASHGDALLQSTSAFLLSAAAQVRARGEGGGRALMRVCELVGGCPLAGLSRIPGGSGGVALFAALFASPIPHACTRQGRCSHAHGQPHPSLLLLLLHLYLLLTSAAAASCFCRCPPFATPP
jgi:hypothetical protein